MPVDNLAPAVASPCSARDELVRRLSTRYRLVLLTVVVLVVADQALIQPLLLRMNGYAPAINMAGRQRMLSQKLAKAALGLQTAADEPHRSAFRAELQDSLSEWSAAHESLQRGASDRRIALVSSPAISKAWSELEPHFTALRRAAETLVRGTAISADKLSAQVETIIRREPAFLRTMDRLVTLMETRSAAEIQRLRFMALAVAGTIVALITALGWFVVRPATRVIRGQVDELEHAVAQRTRKLDEMFVTLSFETAEREAAQVRNQALAVQLAHANRVESVGHLAAGLAHELNQPFAAIVNYTEACHVALEQPLDDQSRPRLKGLIERVRQASLRAGGIVRRIRNFVQPGANTTTPTELVTLVREVVELCTPEAQRAETSLFLQPPAVDEIMADVDPIQIQQVLVNLIQNALHAVQESRARDREIVLRIAAQADVVQIDVADNGQGLAAEDADTLFAPFHTTKAEGLGIGLSICRSIVEKHQGTIWAQSRAPAGAQFSFVLPLSDHAVEHNRQSDSVCR
ncbi:MAG TPA: ATP-binding protein [Lacipirellulaceae bacterium]|nr:ATP-binding protein [Lacipirellulaceae bacterium]